MVVGIISDTHGMLRPEVLDHLKGCELILHAGDIDRQETLDALEEIAPVKVVRGNCDWGWAEHIPIVAEFEIEGRKVCMAHKKMDLPKELADYELVVTGHTHQYSESKKGTTTFLNPGSCGPRRFNQDVTMALAEISADEIMITGIDIPH
jgi:hypothetical protein